MPRLCRFQNRLGGQVGKIRKRLTNLGDICFMPREIILRSEKGVSYYRLSRKLQTRIAMTGAAFVMLWLAASISSSLMTYLWQARGDRLNEIELAYSQLVQELIRKTPQGDQEVASLLAADRSKLALDYLQRMAEGRAALQLMEKEITRLNADLRRSQLALDQENRTRHAAEKSIIRLSEQLAEASMKDKDLTAQLKASQAALKNSIDDQHQMEMAKNDAENSLRDLSQRLADTKAAYSTMLANLTERAHSSLEEMEKIITKAGLKVDDMLAQVDSRTYGQGGPFIPIATNDGTANEAIVQEMAPLDHQVSRLEKLHVVLRSLPLTAPVDRYYVSSTFGGRADPFNGEEGYHAGIDMVGALGSEVLSTAPGKVVFAGWRGNYGKVVEIDHGFGLTTIYAHLKETLVEEGDEVSYRQNIGLLGSTGRSSGPHVHYEVRYRDKPMNPDKFLQAGRYVFKG